MRRSSHIIEGALVVAAALALLFSGTVNYDGHKPLEPVPAAAPVSPGADR